MPRLETGQGSGVLCYPSPATYPENRRDKSVLSVDRGMTAFPFVGCALESAALSLADANGLLQWMVAIGWHS